jgi:hypothetical protein
MIEGSSHTIATGDSDMWLRNVIYSYKDKTKEQVSNAILMKHNLTGVGNLESSEPTNLDTAIDVKSTFKLDPISIFPGPGAMTIPAGLTFGAIDRKMLSKPRETLNFPASCESFSYNNHFVIEFPTTVKITYLPKDVEYQDEASQYRSKYTLDGNKLVVDRELIVQHKSMVCGDEENEMDKRLFPIFDRDMRAQIIYQ